MNNGITTKRPELNWSRNLAEVQNEFDRLFDRFFTHGGPEGARWPAFLDLYEDEAAYHLELDVPGVRRENLEVTVEKGVLRVIAERTPSDEQGRKYWHRERAYGKVERRVTLPETADEESIEAELNGGVLHLTLRKKPEAQPRRIEVKGE